MRHPILTKQRHERELSEIALKIVHIGEDRRREKRSTKNKDENQSSTKKPCHSNKHDKEFTLSLIDFVKKAHPLTTIERDLAPCSKRNLLLLVKWILEWGGEVRSSLGFQTIGPQPTRCDCLGREEGYVYHHG